MVLVAPRALPVPLAPESTDDHLAARALDGDKAAFAALVERYKGQVFALAQRLLRHPADAEDAAQETFARAYVRLASYRPGSNFRAWLLSITSHWCIDQLRRQRVSPLDAYQSVVSNADDPEAQVLRTERHREVRREVAALPEHYRRAVELRYWHGLSYAEVSDALAEPPSTVRMRLFRAHRLMRAGIEGTKGERARRRVGEQASGIAAPPALPAKPHS